MLSDRLTQDAVAVVAVTGAMAALCAAMLAPEVGGPLSTVIAAPNRGIIGCVRGMLADLQGDREAGLQRFKAYMEGVPVHLM